MLTSRLPEVIVSGFCIYLVGVTSHGEERSTPEPGERLPGKGDAHCRLDCDLRGLPGQPFSVTKSALHFLPGDGGTLRRVPLFQS